MNLTQDLWRAKREREAAMGALQLAQAALQLTRDDLFRVIVKGRLHEDEVWSSGIAAAVIGPDGRVDLVELERRIQAAESARTATRPAVGGST